MSEHDGIPDEDRETAREVLAEVEQGQWRGCHDPRYDHHRQAHALGVTFTVPVCRCGTDIADHEPCPHCDSEPCRCAHDNQRADEGR